MKGGGERVSPQIITEKENSKSDAKCSEEKWQHLNCEWKEASMELQKPF